MSKNPFLSLFVSVSLGLLSSASAAAPDLTAGGTPTDTEYWNLGATGMSGWFYHEGYSTDLARQIEVASVDAGSPADGILAVGDVILGADGTGAEPVNFSADARKSLAYAIADAEAATPATLKLLRWRSGITTTVSIDLETLGAYSATAPYNCPKSAAILEKGLDAVMASGASDGYKISLLALLAANDPSNPDNAARMARAQQEAHSLILSQAKIDEYTSGNVVTEGKIAWGLGFKLVAISEYYLATGDPAVYDSMRAYAIAYANGQSMFGTGGHQFAKQGEDGSVNGPYGIGYGVVNSANMQCFYGLVLAREAGINLPEVDAAIERANRFYGSYVDRGSIPYGEHQPGGGHESNGKMGIAALCFKLGGTRDYDANYFTKMAGASADNPDTGHTGPYLNYLWASMGANVGGEESMAAFFAEQSWHYDLSRNWDGSFTYNSYGQGSNGGPSWSSQNLQMYLTTLLTYATPLRQTYTTGKNQDPAKWLTTSEVDSVKFATSYDASARTTNELLADIGHWSPPTRWKAASEIGNRTAEHASLLPTLHAMATNATDPVASRMGACFALGKILDDSSVPVLAGLLTDSENLVQWAASKVLPDFSDAAKMAEIDTLLAACATTAKPLLPLDEADPIHLAHANLVLSIFGSGGAGNPRGVLYGDDLVGIDRALLYPAIRAAISTPLGGARSAASTIYTQLNKEELEAVADAVVDGSMFEAPADRMFSAGVRLNGITALQGYNISEGVPLSKKMVGEMRKEQEVLDALQTLENYAGSSLGVKPDPNIVEFCNFMIANDTHSASVQAILDAIALDQLPDQPTPLKGVDWIFADKPQLTLPEKWTVLRVESYDHVQGDSVYTWRKVHGAGEVSFTPNGTAAAVDTTVVFAGTPGEYLFEVTMSDSRGLTEVTETVAVTLFDTGGTLPGNSAPTADAQSLTVVEGAPAPVVLTGTDPEGYALNYSLVTQPQHGVLSGNAPNLVFTPTVGYTGADSFTFKITDSEGQEASATVNLTIDPSGAVGLAVYEPFNYPAGLFNGSAGSSEVGLDGSWNADSSISLVATSLDYGSLVTGGGSVGNLPAGITFGASRTISSTALTGKGLLDDGATLWFSAVVGPTTGGYTELYLALANQQFTSSNSHIIADDGAQLGSGIGVSLFDKTLRATHFRDESFGTGTSNHVYGTWNNVTGPVLNNQTRLVVGKITWGASSDTIELYMPYEDMALPETASSVLSVNVDQSAYDTLTFSRRNYPVLDEIRFGSTYQSVLQGTVAMSVDNTAPTPDPMTFALAPAASGFSSITMTATPAYDDLGVEYYFTSTAGGGNDSGWQQSNVYTDSGLSAGVSYSYTVKARDRQPGLNETAASAALSAVIPAQGTVPDVVGKLQVTAESLIGDAGFSLGSITTSAAYSLSVPAGHVLSQNPAGDNSAAYGLGIDLVISIGEDPVLPDLAGAGIVDDQGGAATVINSLLTYTVTFSEDMDAATVDAADFTNAGDAAITIGSITEISPGVFTVEVTPTSSGLLRFAVAQGATLSNVQGDALNTAVAAVIDDTTIVVNLPSVTVPGVVGLVQSTAEADLIAANLTVGTIYQIYDETVAAGLVISQNPAAGSSIPGQSSVNLVVSLGTPPDTTGPVIATLAPFDGENNVEVYDKLTVYFDEDLVLGSGNVVIRNLSDLTETTIPVADSSQILISGVVMTIDPTADLLAGKSYSVRIAAGAVADLSGNPFAGVLDNSSWNFSTALTSQETILFTENFEFPDVASYVQGSTPGNWVGANQGYQANMHGLTDKAGGDFSAADPNQQAYAFRAVNTGITTVEGTLANIAEGVTYELSFDVIRDDGKNAGTYYKAQMIAYDPGAARNDARSASPGILLAETTANATDNGSFSTITLRYTVPASDASIGKDLAVRFIGQTTSANIDNVVVKTVNPNPTDSMPPVVTSLTPADNTSSFPVVNNLVVQFNEGILVGIGEIVLKNLSDNTEIYISMNDSNQVIITGSTLTINPTDDLDIDKFYALRIPANGVFDLSGNAYEGIENDTRWSFSTGDISESVAPVIVSVGPADGATDVPYGSNLTAAFDENVVAGSGFITLKNLTDATEVAIAVTDVGQVSISGSTIVIDPADYLGEGKDYAVRFDAGAVLDLSGNPHAGIADDTSWNFATTLVNPPLVASFDPMDDGVDIDPSFNLSMTFDEAVMLGAGNITLRNLNDLTDVVIDVTDPTQVSVSGNLVTIDPTLNLSAGNNYAVLVDTGSIRDLDGNDFAGVTDEVTWNFVSGVSSEGAVLTEDFELASGSPDVTAVDSIGDTSKQSGPQWVRASNGFGADRHGVVDESSGLFTDPTGEQSYAFRYSNSGITTVEGAIGTLSTNATYSVSFYVVLDGQNSGGAYTAQLVTFAPGALRNDVDANQSSILASVSANYTGTNYQLVTFEYTSDGVADAAVQGQDVALRFLGQTSSANIDNIQVAVNGGGGGGGDTIAPTLASSDIIDDATGGPVVPNTLVTYTLTFSEDIDVATMEATDFGNAGTAPVTIGAITRMSAGVFTVEATPTAAGSLQLQVNSVAVIADLAGNALDTSSAILDDTTISVDSVSNSSPVWTSNPVLESSATEGVSYASSLSDDASDADADNLVFSLISGPTWLALAGNGDLSGTPASSDLGTNNFTVSVSDGINPAVEAALSIEVIAINSAPVFASNPFAAADATEDAAYSGTIAGSATDAQSDPISYAKVDGPSWLVVSGDGTLSGAPLNADVGGNSFTVSASDGASATQATLTITVLNVNDAPTWNSDPVVEVDATVDTTYSSSLADDSEDVDGDILTFAKVSGPAWLGVASDGSLSGNPVSSDLGTNTFMVSVSDGSAAPVEASLSIEVVEASSETFADDFEAGANPYGGTTPDVSSYNLNNTSRVVNSALWVRSSDGFGSDRSGLIDESENGALNFTDPVGSQAFGFRYTNSGVTTAEGLIGALASGTTINVSFDVVMDGHNNGTPYQACLLLFDAGAPRNSVVSPESGSVALLATATGQATGDGTYTTVNFSYVVGDPVVDNDGAGVNTATTFLTSLLNKDIALRFDGATTCANIDNVRVSVIGEAPANTAPVADNQSVVTDEDTQVAVTLSASDVDGGAITYAVVSGPSNGTLSGTAPDLTYAPNADYNGTDSFTFVANDGTADSNTATVSIAVNAVNDAPIADNQSGATSEDSALAVTLTGSDADGDVLGYSVLAGPTNGALSGTAPDLTYTPNANYNGADSFTYVANDGTSDSNTATVSITVNAVNDAPLADDQSVATNEDAALAVSLTGSDADGDVLGYTVTAGPANGTLSGTAPSLTYTPNANYNGADSFSYVANDGLENSNTATVSITINAVNDAPVFTSDPFSGSDAIEDSGYLATIAGSASDVDDVSLSYSKSSGPAWLSVAANGDLSGTPANADVGSNSFTMSVSDGVNTAQATLVIEVINTNDAPLADNQSVTTDEDTALAVSLTASDDDGDVLTYTVTTAPANGSLSGTAPNLTYTPNADFNGSDSFAFSANDGTVDSSVATVSITVNAVNDAPLADDQAVAGNEDAALAVSLTGSDVDGDALTYTVTTAPTNGSLSGTAPNLTYTPNADFNGSDSFAFTANDGTVDSGVATVSITINAVNDAPLADDQSVAGSEDAALAVSLTGSDVDGDALTYTVTTAPTNGSLSGTAPNLTYTPNADFNGSDSFAFTANDGTVDSGVATVSITINSVNDAPVFIADPFIAPDATGEAAYTDTIAGSATDLDDATLTYSKVSGPAWLLVAADGSLSGTPLAGDVGINSFIVSASDGTDVVQATLEIFVEEPPFFDDFEVASGSPDVDAAGSDGNTSRQINSALWVQATKGYGAKNHGIVDESHGDFTDPTGEQAYAFRYTNSGITSAESAIGSLITGNTYTVTFDVVVDGHNIGDLYQAQLLTFAAGVARNDIRGNGSYSALLAEQSGSYTGTSYQQVSFSYTADGSEAVLGDDVAIRFIGQTYGAIIDNVKVVVTQEAPMAAAAAPEPQMSVVPDVVGLSQATAESNIVTAGLAVGAVTETYSGSVSAGDVISQGLSAGSSVPEGSMVDLVISLGIDSSPKLVRTTVSSVSNTAWTSVDLGQSYNSAVIIATPIYPTAGLPPVVTRITNITASGFDVKIDRVDGLSDAVSIDVSIVAVDEGVYTQATDGVTMEAVRFTSTLTASKGNWAAEARAFQNTYTNPVVVGQVMSANDASWSVFWSMGDSLGNPVDANHLNVGKHVGEDTDTARADEMIGYIIIESGSGMIEGVAYEAALGSDTVQGFDDSSTPYSYLLSGGLASAGSAAASVSGMNDLDGSWAVLSGDPALTTTSIGLHACEDLIGDTEQSHGTTQIGYIVFE